MTHEQFVKYTYRHSEVMIFHQKHPTMDIEMMLLAVDFDNEMFRLSPIDLQNFEDVSLWAHISLVDKLRAVRMKAIHCKKENKDEEGET